MQVEFVLTGTRPLLMHRDSVDEADRLMNWQRDPNNKGKSVPGDDRSPAWTWQTYLYHDGKNVAMEWMNIMGAIRAAATQMIWRKQKTFKEVSQSGMTIVEDFCDFFVQGKQISMDSIVPLRELDFSEQSNAVRDLGFQLFVKRARVGTSKRVRVRPRFDSWKIRGTLDVSAEELTKPVLAQMLTIAGKKGIGDWRPSSPSPGAFGQFDAKIV